MKEFKQSLKKLKLEEIDPEFCASELYKDDQDILALDDQAQSFRLKQHWIIKHMFEISKEVQANYEKITRQNELLKKLADKLKDTFVVNAESEN